MHNAATVEHVQLGTPYYMCVLSYVYVCMYIPGPLGACDHNNYYTLMFVFCLQLCLTLLYMCMFTFMYSEVLPS